MEDAQGQPLSLGSGFLVRPGVIATNMHVVSGASRGWAKLVGQSKRSLIDGAVAIDEENDYVGAPLVRDAMLVATKVFTELRAEDSDS